MRLEFLSSRCFSVTEHYVLKPLLGVVDNIPIYSHTHTCLCDLIFYFVITLSRHLVRSKPTGPASKLQDSGGVI